MLFSCDVVKACLEINGAGLLVCSEALDGKFSIENVGKGFISKVLVAHNPKKYYLHNDAFVDRLQRPFGLEYPKGLSFGEKYELTISILKEIMKETGFEDFATLDRYIWNIEA